MDFFQPPSVQKRKRGVDDISDEEIEHDFKHRRAISSLPMRSPRLCSTFGSPFSSFDPPAPLTPIDTSEDESIPDEHLHNRNGILDRDSSQGSSNSNTSAFSTKVNVDHNHVADRQMMLPPARPRFGRARSNDLVSPAYLTTPSSTFLGPQSPIQSSERVPTPVVSHFDNRIDTRLSTLPSAPRHSFPPLRQFLSPMMEQDGWGTTNEGGLPSPAEETMQYSNTIDADVMMGYEQTSDGMSGLRVSCDDDDNVMQDTEDTPDSSTTPQHTVERSVNSETHSPRRHHSRGASIAKLHMGYLAGCVKCEQKVPGHYSHILRS